MTERKEEIGMDGRKEREVSAKCTPGSRVSVLQDVQATVDQEAPRVTGRRLNIDLS